MGRARHSKTSAGTGVGRRRRRRRLRMSRRGVASVLAMMFMVMFGSLAVAMAIVSKGNLRTAATHMQVVRSMGAADTGLAVAKARLSEACSRFIVERGEIDDAFAGRLWTGNISSGSIADGGDGRVEVRPPPSGFAEGTTPTGIIYAVRNAFDAEANIIAMPGAPTSTQIHSAPPDADLAVYAPTNWLTTPVIGISGGSDATSDQPAGFQVTFAPLANGTDIRVIVTGYSAIGSGAAMYHYGYDSQTQSYKPLTRVIQETFRIVKRHDHAVLSPSRIMIGKNVRVTGNLGAVYDDVTYNNGHPIRIKSDFYGLDPTLDSKLDQLYAAIAAGDVDGDNRLRVDHAVEGAAIPPVQADGSFSDVTQDGYVDEFDLFLAHYDANHDGKVVLSPALTQGTPVAGQSAEFQADDDLALLIDSANPDRNGNGVSGYEDTNNNGRWDAGEPIADYDAQYDSYPDRDLGWRDGVIDRKDQYAKVRGRLVFRVTEQAWSAAQGPYQQYVQGVIWPAEGESPVKFGATENELPTLTADSFSVSQTPLTNLASGGPFESQVAGQLGISTSAMSTYVESNPDTTAPRYFRSDLDDAYVYGMTGRHLWEKMPFNSPSHSDWYTRPRYENMTFHDVQIPEGNNGLFINCTFVGVTWIRSYTDNTHQNWALYGRSEWDPVENKPVPVTGPLDKSDFLRYTTGNVADGPENYNDFPDPPVINGSTKTGAARNTKQYSNNIRFHDCLFIGSIVSDAPQQYTHVRNKLQFTGSTRFMRQHPDEPNNPEYALSDDERNETSKSSLMVPNYSVDIGQFNSVTDTYPGAGTPQDVRLQGTIVAGVLDVRGNAEINGTLLLTFKPVLGEGPLQQNGQPVGNPAGFNATLGYFGPDDGDGESLDPQQLPFYNGERIVGWDLDNDGIPDLPHDQTPTQAQLDAGATPVPFYGYGRIELNWNPDLPMPDGIMLPLSSEELASTYKEGRG